MNIIQEYLEKFPEAIEAIAYSNRSRKDSRLHTLADIYPDMGKDQKPEMIKKLKSMLGWIERLPLSKLPYVEMGFDALDINLVKKLQDHSEHVSKFYKTVDLKVQETETMKFINIF